MRGGKPKYRSLDDLLKNTIDDGRCLLWRGKRDPRGYGRVCVGNGKTIAATRLVVSLLEMAEINCEVVMHTCDRPQCINPAHLRQGTKQLNSDDMKTKGRDVVLRGSTHGMAKIGEEHVLMIRAMRGTVAHIAIAEMFGLSKSGVGHIMSGKNWKHLLAKETK